MTFAEKCKVMYEEDAVKMIKWLIIHDCKDNAKYSHISKELPNFEAFFNEFLAAAKVLCVAFEVVRKEYNLVENGYVFRKNYAQDVFHQIHLLYWRMFEKFYGKENKAFLDTDYLCRKVLYDNEIEF